MNPFTGVHVYYLVNSALKGIFITIQSHNDDVDFIRNSFWMQGCKIRNNISLSVCFWTLPLFPLSGNDGPPLLIQFFLCFCFPIIKLSQLIKTLTI